MGPRNTHFEYLSNRGIIIVAKASQGTNFWDVELAFRSDDFITNMNLNNLPINHLNPAMIRITPQAVGR
jgi:hypothetical protein